jgi:hypothetical protein
MHTLPGTPTGQLSAVAEDEGQHKPLRDPQNDEDGIFACTEDAKAAKAAA